MRIHRVGGSMNEVAHAFWNHDNQFWLFNKFGNEKPLIAFHRKMCDCEIADLKIENGMTLPLTNDELAQYLTDNDSVIIWNLETRGATEMNRKVEA